jgi:acylphosphatase
MKRAAFLLIVFAGCTPLDPALAREREVDGLVADLPDSEARVVAIGEEAVPSLAHALRSARPPRRGAAARALGLIHRAAGSADAAKTYADVVEHDPAPDLLEHAWLFDDPGGRVLRTLATAIAKSRGVTPGVLRAAATLTDTVMAEPMLSWIGGTRELADAPGRDLALRYLGRAVRRGRMDILHFLTLAEGSPELLRGINEELAIAAGKLTYPNWRGWYLDVAKKKRWDWLAEAQSIHLQEPFDPSNRAHVDRIIAGMRAGDELEPEFALLEPLLSRRFNYVSPRDVFEPGRSLEELNEANARALETLQAWWRENGPFAWHDARDGRWAINEEARAAGTPVDPKTGRIPETKD